MASGSSPAPKIQQAAPIPTQTDPNVQNARAGRLSQARYSKGFMSTISPSDQGSLGGGSTVATSGSNPVGTVAKLG
jgi:hypothetical protein